MRYYICNDEGMCGDSKISSNLDCLVEVLVGVVKSENWWVVVECLENKIVVGDVIEEMGRVIKNKLVEMDVNVEENKSGVWCFDSISIMSDDYVILVVEDEKDIKKLDSGVGMDVDINCVYDKLGRFKVDVEVCENVVEYMGNKDSGVLLDIVNSLK